MVRWGEGRIPEEEGGHADRLDLVKVPRCLDDSVQVEIMNV